MKIGQTRLRSDMAHRWLIGRDVFLVCSMITSQIHGRNGFLDFDPAVVQAEAMSEDVLQRVNTVSRYWATVRDALQKRCLETLWYLWYSVANPKIHHPNMARIWLYTHPPNQ